MRKHSTRLSQEHDEEPEDGGQHTAARDYPELGSILNDRPDPGRIITVIGLRKTAAAYGTEDDARNGEYNGGPGDTGLYWAEPAQQNWAEEHLGPQEEAPPPPWAMSPVMARLAEIEEARGLIGMSHHATTINGTQIDEHGDAPGHGTEHRAQDPDSYDGRSTEGDGDPRWSGDDDPHKKEKNGATVGMFPEGISSGNGPGLPIGSFTARVPWTPHERGTLHSWQEVPPSSTIGDFVPSATFPLLGAGEHVRHQEHGPEPEPLPEGFPVEAAFGPYDEPFVPGAYEPRTDRYYSGGPGGTEEEYDPQEWTPYATAEDHAAGRHQEQAHTLSSLHVAATDPQWEMHMRIDHGWGPENFERVRQRGDRLSDMHAALHSAGMANHEHEEDPSDIQEAREQAVTDRFGPDLRDLGPRMTSPAGYPLARPQNGGSSGYATADDIAASRPARFAPPDHWRQTDIDQFRRRMNALNVHVRIDGKELKHEHDDGNNSLDHDRDDPGPSGASGPGKSPDGKADKNSPGIASSQADDVDSLDSPADIPGPQQADPDAPGFPPDHPMADPGNWPAAGADVTERPRAYTQGRDDGKVNRGGPLGGPPPGAGDDADDPGGTDDPDDSGDDSSSKPPFSKDAALGMFTAAIADPAFRFEFTASWADVRAKAKRIRAEGHVRITHASSGMVIGEVRGDHDTYESGIQRKVGKRSSIQHWACGCPWATFNQDKSLGTRYAGRPCSHVMALQFEAQARGMFGRPYSADGELPAWAPPTVVVKSYPPYEGDPHAGQWHEQWRAPVSTVNALRNAVASNGWNDWDEAPEQAEQDGTAQERPGTPECLYRHRGTCPPVRSGRTGESLRHSRPRGFWSEIRENPDFDPHSSSEDPEVRSTHVLRGYIGPTRVGQLHFTLSDDGRAHHVDMLHSGRSGMGIGSALMDDLYSHVKRQGGWLDHGMRTTQGAKWWASYSEPYPEVSTHVAHPEEGWGKYFHAGDVAEEADFNEGSSNGHGNHPDQHWYDAARGYYNDGSHQDQWTHAMGLGKPEWHATAALIRGGEDPEEVGALRLLAGLSVTADQANGPWGSNNMVAHPPGKPYGATSPPDKDMDPGSYGPLSAPDPENWGEIQDNSAYQMPLTNTAAHQVLVPGAPRPVPGDLHWPDTKDWQPENQGTFGYTDHASTAGPSTAMNPRDPQGIRMEEALASGTPYPFRDTIPQLDGALAELRDHPEPALPSTTGDDEIEATAAADGTIGGGDAGTGEGMGAPLDTAALGEFGAARTAGPTSMGDQAVSQGLSGGAQAPSPVGQNPGMGSLDEYLTPDDQSIQTVGTQQWSGGGADSDETAVPAGQPQGGIDDIVAAFQRSAAAKAFAGGGPSAGAAPADGDIAAAARQFLSKTADVLPKAEADELISEGRGDRARNLGLLRLEGTHYEEADSDMDRRGVSLDDYDDDVLYA